jgi:hypothetical protein
VNATLTALQQLTAEAHIIRERNALASFEPHHAVQRLSTSLDKLRERASTVPTSRPKADVNAIWAKFEAARYDFDAIDGLEFRALCCAEETAVRSEFVAALEKAPELLKRARCIYGLVNGYFARWRTMASPDRLETLLYKCLDDHAGKNLVLNKWRKHRTLFTAQASASLAKEICSEQCRVEEILQRYLVSPITNLGLAARAASARMACDRFRMLETGHDDGWSIRFLQWMTENVLSDLTPAEIFTEAISAFILSESARRSEAFQSVLKSYVQSHKRLGDPRTRESAPNWRMMAPEANQRYLSWLARDSIIFFFNTILPNTNENRRRKDFWLRYHDRIRDFQVAVSENDAWKVKANQHKSELLYHSRIAHPTTSAFLMQFEGWGGAQYIVIEFSENGNAAYIYRLADFEGKRLSLRTPRFTSLSNLKFDKTHRIFHNGEWEPRTAYRLASDFGIRP